MFDNLLDLYKITKYEIDGFIVFLLIFFMAFWCLIFLASVVPFFILVWLKEGN